MTCIFISYRRADNAAGYSRSLGQALRREFGDAQVFRDIKSIPPGQDFPAYIEQTLSKCRVMLVLIGTQWTRVTNNNGERRLDNPDDWVRREVAAALQADMLVIPVLVCGAQMPAASELPADIASLADRNAFVMSDDDWEHDLEQLVDALGKHAGLRSLAASKSAAGGAIADVLREGVRHFSVRQLRSQPGIFRRALKAVFGWVRALAIIAIGMWIGYTQNDSFAAAVDRFLARTAEMLSRLIA